MKEKTTEALTKELTKAVGSISRDTIRFVQAITQELERHNEFACKGDDARNVGGCCNCDFCDYFSSDENEVGRLYLKIQSDAAKAEKILNKFFLEEATCPPSDPTFAEPS